MRPYETLISDPETYIEFIDHIDLKIPILRNRPDLLKIKSIMLPNSSSLFTEKLYTNFQIETNFGKIRIRLMDEVGCIITKACSFTNKKRSRDSFDIFQSIYQSRDYGKLVNKFKNLIKSNPILVTPLIEKKIQLKVKHI